jgi:hypothetical protein
MAKYDALREFLAGSPAAEISLGFPEIEQIIGARLPRSAKRRQYWANEVGQRSTHVQCRAWQAAGFRAFASPATRGIGRGCSPGQPRWPNIVAGLRSSAAGSR